MAEKTVLCVCKGRRRPVTFLGSHTNVEEDRKSLKLEIESVFSDLLLRNAEQPEQGETEIREYFIERESQEWGGLIDLTGLVQDRDILHLKWSESPLKSKVSPTEVTRCSGKAKNICNKLGTPSEANAKVLAGLFPSYNSGSKKRKRFDPSDECVVAESHRKKKSSSGKGRPKVVEVVTMKEIPNSIPKGDFKEHLRKIGQVKNIPFSRHLSVAEVDRLLANTFTNLGSDIQFQYLKPHRKNRLTVLPNQNLNGREIVQLAKTASLYLKILEREEVGHGTAQHPFVVDDSSCADTPELNVNEVGSSTQHCDPQLKNRDTSQLSQEDGIYHFVDHEVVVDMDAYDYVYDDIYSNYEHELASPTHLESTQELRELRSEQDRAYQESLEADIAKEELRQHISLWKKKIEDITASLQLKFARDDSRDATIKIGFKLPDGSKEDYCFQPNATVQELYQFVLYKGIPPPFTLLIGQPYEEIPLQSLANTMASRYAESLLHVRKEESGQEYDMELLEYFTTSINKSEESASSAAEMSTSNAAEVSARLDNEFSEFEDDRKQYLEASGAIIGEWHEVNRSNLFEDVLSLYRKGEVGKQYLLSIRFKNERGLDEGGLSRDMLAGFWIEAYSRYFEGATTLIPMIHPQIDLSVYPLLGEILSHGYLATGTLADKIALPTLISIFLGPGVALPPDIVMDAFLDYLSAAERSLLKSALQSTSSFSPSLLRQILAVLSRFGCRTVPTPSSLPDIIKNMAVHEFCTKPAAAIAMMNTGVHRGFWATKSPQYVQKIHRALTATPSKVISLLNVSDVFSPAEERIVNYLTTMIGNMSTEDLRNFLRFVTGASVCVASTITIQFNQLSGFARRPISHTCDCSLELPIDYSNYEDFLGDFKPILLDTKNEFTWLIDAL